MVSCRKYAVLAAALVMPLLCPLFAMGKATALPNSLTENYRIVIKSDTPPPGLPYPWDDQSYGVPFYNPNGGLLLSQPSNIKTDVEYNPETGKYDIYQKMGSLDYRPPMDMDSDQYEDYLFNQSERNYFHQKSEATSLTKQQQNGLIPPIHIGGKAFQMIFGSNTVSIRPQGSAELIFGFNNSKIENPALPVLQRSLTTFNFDENIQLNVTGEIGDKLKLSTNYNTKATFDFQNQMKLGYTGHEDDIIKSIQAGNITFPLPGTLITGSQSLFGVEAKLQFGRLTATMVYSQEKGEKKTITVQNGSQTTNFNIKMDQYMANQHYFLSKFFYDLYDQSLANLPVINSSVNITRIEVWVTNTTTQTQNTRNILAFSDLGESPANWTLPSRRVIWSNRGYPKVATPPYDPPNDTVNSLDPSVQYARNPNVAGLTTALGVLAGEGFQQVTDFEKVDLARMLSPSEYTLNSKLGYISLRQPLNYDQVLAVAYQYTYNGQVFQVGQFSTDGVPTANELMVKMLKSTNVSPEVPLWQLMMKNIYSLGSFQINAQNFMLNIWYNNPATGVDIPYLPTGKYNNTQLLQVCGLDQLDQNGDRVPDGLFDFLPGVTIDAANGLVIFPSVEPFGQDLEKKLAAAGYPATGAGAAGSYIFQALYDSILVVAQEQPNYDRYWLRGSFQSSSSSDISLGAMNIPPGSVIVTAGGITLTENVDYTVDYTLGRVKILNQGLLSSGTPIQISLENNALFSIESKTYAGAHFDYMVNKDFTLGATVINYTEHPLTQIVMFGQEPVSNTMLGLNEDFKAQAPWLTRAIDALPFIHTKAPSEITASTEIAAMIPGHPKYIGSTGTAYIDDFDGSESFIDISQPYTWSIASTPQGQPSVFPEGQLNDTLPVGYNRAKVSWFVVDPLFQQEESGLTPADINTDSMSNNFYRMVLQTEVFPQEQSPTGTPINLPVLNLEYYPTQKGPYNYDVGPSPWSKGIDVNGNLLDPTTRWGGIMRAIQQTDFESANIGYIEFWMMDPYNSDNTDPNTQGTLYFDLGDVSEDVMKDGIKSFENGLPTDAADYVNPANLNNPYTTSVWGREPVNPNLVNAFANSDASRPFQDAGLDGLVDSSEQTFFSKYLNAIKAKYGANSPAYQNAFNDPSSDDYHYYRGDDYDKLGYGIQQRYSMYCGLEGNSATQTQYGNLNPIGGNYPTTESTLPNTEDINQNNTLDQDEAYYEYQVQMTKQQVNPANVGNNYITDAFQGTVQTPNGQTKQVWWYQFKIPITNFIRRIGPISDFHSIRFIRMYFKGADKPIRLRFAQLEFVQDEWRQYTGSLLEPGDYLPNDMQTEFDMYGVNLEENGSTAPVNYVIPPGIQRQLNLQSANLVQENEGSLALNVCNLQSGDARGVYKAVQLDLRAYTTLNMFVHCQAGDPTQPLDNGAVQGFIRLGSDFTQNYYEYAVPCQVTPPGSYNTNNPNDQLSVWPEANTMSIALTTLENAKLARNAALLANPNLTVNIPYSVNDGNNIVTIVGNPTISNVQEIMLGVRNPKRTEANAGTNDGKPKCAQVWFDELRLTGFSEKGGVAAISRVTAKLADLGTLSLSGNIKTPGFGQLETTVGDLSRETDLEFDLASNLQMDKFFPKEWNLSIPMYVGYTDQVGIPEYDPLNPDILMSTELASMSKTQQEALKAQTLTVTKRNSLNFTNVHKNRGKNSKKNHIWDVENFSGTFAYSEQNHSDVNTAFNIDKTTHAALTYNYSFRPKSIQPLIKSPFFKKRKYLALIGDFNFYPLPDLFAFNENVDRDYNAFQLRFALPNGEELPMPTPVSRTFNLVRTWALPFPITKSLKFEYGATDDARVMEPEGTPITTNSQRDSVVRGFFNHQVNTDFKQTVKVTYEVPFNKVPALDFINMSAHYEGSYEWIHAPFAADSLGATIQNSSTKSINGQLNMLMFYNKIPLFKDMLSENRARPPARPMSSMMRNRMPGMGKNLSPKARDSLRKIDIQDSIRAARQNDSIAKSKSYAYYAGKTFVTLLTMVKNVSFSYTNTTGTILPGFNDSTRIFGMDDRNNWAPGVPFVFGFQNSNQLLNSAGEHNWIVNTTAFYTPYSTTNTQSLSLHATLEPIPDMKMDLTANRTSTASFSEYVHDSANMLRYYTPTEAGNFSMSYFCVRTAFVGIFGGGLNSPLFNNYLSFRSIISQRVAAQNPNSGGYIPATGYFDGYSGMSQNVVIPAFLAAYSGQNPNTVSTNPFPQVPLPNYSLTYTGLSKIKWVRDHFQNVTISNAYTSSYSVGGYSYNLLYDMTSPFPNVRDINGDFLPLNEIPTVALTSQFNPLLKISGTFKTGVMSDLSISTVKQAALNMSDLTIDEVNSDQYVLGLGYKIKNFILPFKVGGKAIKNDLTLKADLSFMVNETLIRSTLTETSQITGGQSILSIKPQIEYTISKRVSARIYFDKIINNPYISSSYPTSTMDGGLAIRFTLS